MSGKTKTFTSSPDLLPGSNFLMKITGVSVAVLGAVVLLGWHIRNYALLQILPEFVPMQYNTALGFLLTGAGVFFLGLGRRTLAFAAGTAAGIIGFLTLMQYVFHFNLGIDELLMKHYTDVGTSSPGRMAPNTALCFLLTGLAMVAGAGKGRNIKYLIPLLSAAVFSLAAIAFLGYLFGQEMAFGWGSATRMAAHTAAGFILLSLPGVLWGKGDKKSLLVPSIVLIVGAVIATHVYFALRDAHKHFLKLNFEMDAQNRISDLKSQIDGTYDALTALKSFYDGSQFVDRKEFREFAIPLLKRRPCIFALEWVPYVAAAEAQKFLNDAAADGLTEFRFLDAAANGRLVPAGSREEYYPVFYVEPAENNQNILGYDHSFSRDRKEALLEARDTGKITASKWIRLVRENEEELWGVLLAIPVYQKGVPENTAEWRRKNLMGFATAVHRMRDLTNYILEGLHGLGVDFYLYDSEGAEGIAVGGLKEERFSYIKNFRIAGREWTAVFQTTDDYLKGKESPAALIALIVGYLLTILLAGFLYNRQQAEDRMSTLNLLLQDENRTRKEAEQKLKLLNESLEGHVRQRTVELQAKQEALDQFAMVAETAPDGKILRVNRKFCEITGYSKEDVVGKDHRMFSSGAHPRVFWAEFWSVLKNKKIWRGEVKNKNKKGEEFWVEMSVIPILTKNNELEEFLSISTDITERKKAEQALKLQSEDLRKMNDLMIGRELRMIQIKEEINALRSDSGKNSPGEKHFQL